MECLNQSLQHPNGKDSPPPKNTNNPMHRSLFIKERRKVLVGRTGTTRGACEIREDLAMNVKFTDSCQVRGINSFIAFYEEKREDPLFEGGEKGRLLGY
ncbi:hypothetical protein CEXT_390211 [Caerostris extrusa]|uniref:Uncharacterized protein n=1 Tax=Caerostris extrusa TaxID=172846 RepID=A0AAV4QG61_CAEEX|nr:hypothetical protein CEXT_390211 [Caerostris extrusa]